MAEGSAISYICIARADSKDVVAQWSASNPAEYRTSVRQVLEAPDFAVKAIPGKRFRLDGSFNTTWFTTDRNKVVWLAMTNKSYPQRTMFAMLQELQDEVNGGSYGSQLQGGGENQFTKKIKPVLKKYAAEYADPAAKDDLTRVMVKVRRNPDLCAGDGICLFVATSSLARAARIRSAR